MSRRALTRVGPVTGTIAFDGAGTQYLVHANNGAIYYVYVDNNQDVTYRKSTDGGIIWGDGIVVFAGTATNMSVWYDRWSGLSTDLIHVAYTESVTDDTLYRTIDTGSSDTLSTQTSIFAGTSTAAGGHLSITRAVGGNVYCKTVIDAGAEGGFFRLPNANVPNGAWDAARTVDETIATQDQMILLPDLTAADTQDIMAIFWDASADEISRKLYDDSANSWAETSIATTMVDRVSTNDWPNFSATVDLTNSRILLAAWSTTDAANADLRMWRITNSSISEQTNVVLNSTDDQGMCGITVDTANADHIVVFYVGKSDGSETYNTDVNLYCKATTDGGSTWGPETLLTEDVNTTLARRIRQIVPHARTTGKQMFSCGIFHTYPTGEVNLFYSLDITQPSAGFNFGM